MESKKSLLGLDLGGTSVKYGLATPSGEIIRQFQRPSFSEEASRVIIENLLEAAFEAKNFAAAAGYEVVSVGVGTPGSVDVTSGLLMGGTPNLAHWKKVPLKAELENALKIPVFVDNDANMMVYGEFVLGAAKGLQNIVGVTLGTGIGGGIIIGGEIFRGSRFAGAELGHMSVAFDGIPCRCGGKGCWEKYASATAMIELYNSLNGKVKVNSTRQIFDRLESDDSAAQRTVEMEIQAAAVGVANILNIFNPEIVVIGGGVSEAGDWFVERIAARSRERAMEEAARNVRIVRAALGNSAGWLGAALLANAPALD